MKRYGLWKYLLILLVLCFGVIYSLPNLYAPDPAVQISYTSSSQTADTFLADKVKELIEKQNLEAKKDSCSSFTNKKNLYVCSMVKERIATKQKVTKKKESFFKPSLEITKSLQSSIDKRFKIKYLD